MAKKQEHEERFVPPVVKPGTPAAEALLSAGYDGMTVEQANEIVKGRKETPGLYSYEKYEKAVAFLAAYNATEKQLVPSSTKPGWKRNRSSRYNQD
jgi:hypothetical protein